VTYTIGSYLAARFSQIGLKHHFAVAETTIWPFSISSSPINT